MNYKLIAIDMDGTLLTSEKRVTDNTKRTLQKVSERGIKIVVCTGRIFTSALIYADIIGTKAPIIASNGAYIREKDMNQVVYCNMLPTEKLIKIVTMAKEFELYPQLFTFDTIFSEKLIHASLNYTNWNDKLPEESRVKIKIADDLDTIIKENEGEILKVVIYAEDIEKLNSFRETISNCLPLSIVSSYSNNIELMNFGISKGSAVKILAEYYGYRPEEIICFGDAENDISMLEYAGLGVAMGNAQDYVKAAADYVTDTNDNEGVAKAIEKYIFGL